MSEPIPTCRVLGVPLAATDYAGAVECARAWARAGGVHAIAATATHPITAARCDPAFRETLAAQDLILPDGMPLIWVMNRRMPRRLHDRVYGPTFMLRLLEATQGEPWPHFFLGGTDEMLAALRSRAARALSDAADRRRVLAALYRLGRGRGRPHRGDAPRVGRELRLGRPWLSEAGALGGADEGAVAGWRVPVGGRGVRLSRRAARNRRRAGCKSAAWNGSSVWRRSRAGCGSVTSWGTRCFSGISSGTGTAASFSALDRRLQEQRPGRLSRQVLASIH